MTGNPEDKTARRPKPEPKDRHPALRGTPVGTFCPTAVGLVRGYPRTEEAYRRQCERLRQNSANARARGRLNRRGVPNGWAGRRDEVTEIRRNSHTEAERIVEVVMPEAESEDDEYAAIAMKELLAMVLDTTGPTSFRLGALKTALRYLVPKPTARARVAEAGGGLAFLSKLAEAARRRDGAG